MHFMLLAKFFFLKKLHELLTDCLSVYFASNLSAYHIAGNIEGDFNLTLWPLTN